MKAAAVWVFLSVAVAAPQESGQRGVIYGAVIAEDGNPAIGVGLTASLLDAPLATALPFTRTDQNGNYRFEKLPWWGRYTVYADDSDAGYSIFSTGPAGPGRPPEVTISPEHPEARLDLHLPPKAGFLRIHLINQLTGAVISGMQVTVMSNQTPPRLLFSESCSSNMTVLIPPNKDLLLHVVSPGFHEWTESAGTGNPIHMTPGSLVELEVQLVPE